MCTCKGGYSHSSIMLTWTEYRLILRLPNPCLLRNMLVPSAVPSVLVIQMTLLLNTFWLDPAGLCCLLTWNVHTVYYQSAVIVLSITKFQIGGVNR